MENPVMGLTPYLTVSDAKAAIEFYQKALGATEIARHGAPGTEKLMHVRMDINGSVFFFADDFPEFHGGKSNTPLALGGTPITLHLQVEDGRQPGTAPSLQAPPQPCPFRSSSGATSTASSLTPLATTGPSDNP